MAKPTKKPLEINLLDATEFLALEIQPKQQILAPWLQTQGLAMIHAYRGIGKTWITLGISAAVSTGGMFLGWSAPRPRPVIYVDGEMPASTVQERLRVQFNAMRCQPEEGFLRILTPDFQPMRLPDLSVKDDQERFMDVISGSTVDLIVLDNVATLFRTGKENEAEAWLPAQEFALLLRRTGVSVIFVHHSGKEGRQRGTSRREDVLDTVINLRQPKDYQAEDGARFNIFFEKARGLYGEDVKPFEARLDVRDERAMWSLRDAPSKSDKTKQVCEMSKEGMSSGDIAEEMGVSKATVSRHLKIGKERGWA